MPKFREISSNLAFRNTAGESNFTPIWRVRPPLSYLRAVLQHHFELLALNDPLPQHLTHKKLCTLNRDENCWENIDRLLMGRVSCFLIDKNDLIWTPYTFWEPEPCSPVHPHVKFMKGQLRQFPQLRTPDHKEPLRIGSRNLLTLFTAYLRVG